jgi:LysR family transcriptional regulator, glycine cleavage system transcriptional activator
MPNRRYNLPHLAFFQGFEAAARTLSFTKAAEELFITQSAVSRQIKALEDNLGLKLFERRPRSLTLTEDGQALYRIATDVLDRLQSATDQLRAETRARQLSITTTTGFASLWLIPRLSRFTALHPDIDVRISATTDTLNLERSLIDLAIRYCKPETAPEGAVRLFGDEMIPVCSRALLRDKTRPLKRPQDLAHHTLLHFDYAGAETMYMDWGTWLTALGIAELKSAGALHFSQYEHDPGGDQRPGRGAGPSGAGQRSHRIARARRAVQTDAGWIACVFHHRIAALRRQATGARVRTIAAR